MDILVTLGLLLFMVVLLAIDPAYFLIALLILIAVVLLDFFARHRGLFLTLLGLGFLFSLFNGDDDDGDCDM